MTTKARIVRFAAPGGPEVLKLETIDLPDPGPGEVQVRQTAVGLNFQEIYQRSGFYPMPLPAGLGNEAAGVVVKAGPGVSGFAPGERVCYAGGGPGAYTDIRNVVADRLLKTPDGVSDELAAASMLKGMTVEYLLNRCYPVKAGQSVLFYAASGGVGLLAGQWGKHLGARMIGVAGGADKCKLALANGYDAWVLRDNEADLHLPHYIQIMGGVIWLEPLREFESRIRKALASSAKDMMTSDDLLTVSPETSAAEAGKLIVEHGHNRLPVVDGDGKLVGVVTRVDVLSALAG